MRDLTLGVLEHLEITSPMDVDKRLSYMQRILVRAEIKNYQEVLVTCRQLANKLAGDV